MPFKFKMSPIEDIENDLLEAQVLRTNPSKMLNRLQGKGKAEPIQRIFLTGANPFVLKTEKLLEIASLIRNWEDENELEKYRELRTLVENLDISTTFAAMGASNPFQLSGHLPRDKERLLKTLDKIITEVSEEDLRYYRKNLPHL